MSHKTLCDNCNNDIRQSPFCDGAISVRIDLAKPDRGFEDSHFHLCGECTGALPPMPNSDDRAAWGNWRMRILKEAESVTMKALMSS